MTPRGPDTATPPASTGTTDTLSGSADATADTEAPTPLDLGSAPTAAEGDTGANTQRSPRLAASALHETVTATQRYRLVEEHARGGMGRILLGADESFERRVAVKELLTDDASLRVRFEREARITAMLQHPGVVPVYAAGEHAGRPFYAMRLVTGSTLASALAAAPQLDARLALLPQVLAVVETIAYAHKHGVLHRDLKPANVMLGEFGEAIVIDWGLGKIVGEPDAAAASAPASTPPTDDDSLTHVGTTMGTPAYMPIEQARGEPVDARADVYALGAILYELFTGSPPYMGRRADELLAAVLAGPPRPLSTDDAVPPELVAIVNRAMARDAASRYPDAAGLADDLRRYLRGQLVGAHRYTIRHLVVRWIRRHRAIATVSLLAVISIAATIGIAFQRVVAERDRTEGQREIAEKRRKAGARLTQFALDDLGAELDKLGRLELIEGLGLELVKYYESSGSWQSDRQAAVLRIQSLTTLAEIAATRSRMAEASARLLQALAIAEQWPVTTEAGIDEDPMLVFTLETQRATLLAKLAMTLFQEGRREDAQRYRTRAAEAARVALAWRIPDEKRELMLSAQASLLEIVYMLHQALGDIPQQTATATDLLRVTEQLLATRPDDPAYRQLAAGALYRRAYDAYSAGRLTEARAHNSRALGLVERLEASASDTAELELVAPILNLQGSLSDPGQRPMVLERALALAVKLRNLDLENLRAAANELAIARQLAIAWLEQGDSRRALGVLEPRQAAIQLIRDAGRDDAFHRRFAAYYDNARGRVLAALGRRPEAEAEQRRCFTAMKTVSATAVEPDVLELLCAASLAELLGPRNAEAHELARHVRAHLTSPTNASQRAELERALTAFSR